MPCSALSWRSSHSLPWLANGLTFGSFRIPECHCWSALILSLELHLTLQDRTLNSLPDGAEVLYNTPQFRAFFRKKGMRW